MEKKLDLADDVEEEEAGAGGDVDTCCGRTSPGDVVRSMLIDGVSE